MAAAPEEWPEPRVTNNCHLLAGYLAATLSEARPNGGERMYGVAELSNPLIVEHRENGNRYRVTVEQISGTE